MVAVPPVLVELLNLRAGPTVSVTVDSDRLVIEPQRPCYTMAEFVAASDYSRPQPAEEREWVDVRFVGGELA